MSDEFGPLARAEATVLGIAALPFAAIPHPLAGNEDALVRAKAAAIVDEIVAALTDSPEVLGARHAGRFLALTERRLDHGAVCVDEVCAYDPTLVQAPEDREVSA